MQHDALSFSSEIQGPCVNQNGGTEKTMAHAEGEILDFHLR